ncbi:MAG: hypothetical protein F6J86_42585, partial [Symploca sp. SIO1B1]|nr:hypothetical protein [Symploca sp. SIO1B1]
MEQKYDSTTAYLWNWHLASHQNPDLIEITTGGQPVPQEYDATTAHLWNWHLASHQNPDLIEITTGGQPVPQDNYLTKDC